MAEPTLRSKAFATKATKHEKPIPMNADSVRGLMTCAQCGHVTALYECPECGCTERVKTQTRRVIPECEEVAPGCVRWKQRRGLTYGSLDSLAWSAPYAVGDRLWVREGLVRSGAGGVVYQADRCPVMVDGESLTWRSKRDKLPSIFMPKWAARIRRTVTAVRAERLQDIDKLDRYGHHIGNDAWAEGFRTPNPLAAFMLAWERIHGPGAWERNPWVFVYEFKPEGGSDGS